MYYILNYRLFESKNQMVTLNLLKNSNSMKNIIALYPDKKNYYEVNTLGNIIFGVGMNPPMGKIQIQKNDNKWRVYSRAIEKDFENLEECLRFFWAYVISINMRAYLNRKKTLKTFYEDKKYWDSGKSFSEIFKLEVPDKIEKEGIEKGIRNINNKINKFGLSINFNINSNVDDTYRIRLKIFDSKLFIPSILEMIIKKYTNSTSLFIKENMVGNHFVVKRADIEKEFFNFFKKLNFYEIELKNANGVKLEDLKAHKILGAYIKYMYEDGNIDNFIVKYVTENPNYSVIHYLETEIPDIYDRLPINSDDLKSGSKMGNMGFDD